jgi:hypothetical protein
MAGEQRAERVTPREALGLYERNWRHFLVHALTPGARALVDALQVTFWSEVLRV